MNSIGVGLVGTGYAAKLRAETLRADERSHLVAVAGHDPTRTAEFCQPFGVMPLSSWQELVQMPAVDLVVVATVNRDHGAIVRAALKAGKHVVVEYPLSLELADAQNLIELSRTTGKLLHIEHIELLSGIHLAAKSALPTVGTPFYVRYSNLNPQRPAPNKWTYQPELFGFPLMGAVSRIHRLTDLFGTVSSVSCQARFWSNSGLPSPYTSCLCTAQLRFVTGLVAEVIYGKGEALWQAERSLTIHAERGAILIDGETGTLVQGEDRYPLEMGSRRGLFARDTAAVLNHLTQGSPLYVTPEASLYALTVADAARRSAETGHTCQLS